MFLLSGSFTTIQEENFDYIKLLLLESTESENNQDVGINSISRQNSIKQSNSSDNIIVEKTPEEVEEQRSRGSTSFDTYRAYFRAGGNCCVIFIVFAMFILTQIFVSGADYFVSFW